VHRARDVGVINSPYRASRPALNGLEISLWLKDGYLRAWESNSLEFVSTDYKFLFKTKFINLFSWYQSRISPGKANWPLYSRTVTDRWTVTTHLKNLLTLSFWFYRFFLFMLFCLLSGLSFIFTISFLLYLYLHSFFVYFSSFLHLFFASSLFTLLFFSSFFLALLFPCFFLPSCYSFLSVSFFLPFSLL
jgi:hypothetical protein